MQKIGSLTELARELFTHLDKQDFDWMLDRTSDDVQGVDEISRSWMRGRSAMAKYFDDLRGKIANIESTLRDIQTLDWDHTGVVTGTLEQTYTLDGHLERIVAPTTIIFRQEAGAWKIALVHSVPLAEPASS